MHAGETSDIVQLVLDPIGDPGARKLAAAITAHFELEKATARRRGWMSALAALSVPAILAVAFPSFLGPALRAVELVVWLGCACAWGLSLAAELRWVRAVERLTSPARAR